MQKRSGFTLIELLVVIAIIAILASILFPVFAQAREKARQATCVSNQKQILLAIMQYTQDFDEMLPRGQVGAVAWSGNIPADEAVGMENELDPYIKAGNTWGPERSSSVWKCPSDTYKRDDCAGGPGVATGYDISYAFTNYDSTNPRKFGVFAFSASAAVNSQTLSGVGRSGDTIIMWDWWNPQAYSRYEAVTRTNMDQLLQFPAYPDSVQLTNYCGDGYDWNFSFGSHGGMTNFGFMDGHVKASKREQLWNVDSSKVWDYKAPNKMHWNEQYH